MESLWLYRLLPVLPYFLAVGGGILSGFLVYGGLTDHHERRHYRLRLKNTISKSKTDLVGQAENSMTEQLLKQARYPFGLTAVRVYLVLLGILTYLTLNYVVLALLTNGYIRWTPFIIGIAGVLLVNPDTPFSPNRFILKKFIEYRKAKQVAELFSLYDMLVSEIEMMRTMRVNVYSLLRVMLPYFDELKPAMTKMLMDWTSSTVGPTQAVDAFAKEIDTSEAQSLATVLKTFDDNSRETLLESLKGMEDMFITSQIENNRRRRKLFIDLVGMPVKTANFLILLNAVLVIVMMVMKIMDSSNVGM